ncbi:hypothetical protein DNG35_10065 [Mesonia sp. K7]|nr:hypothetical protein DNG35_10065 [Mesonia sp. K7]
MFSQSPCDTIEDYRRFDFWLGEWEVFSDGNKIAESSITLTKGNCGIIENYNPFNNAGGSSISYFDAADKKWKQEWVANGHVSHYVEPNHYTEGEMQLVAKHIDQKGNEFWLRMIYYYDKKQDSVRQLMERSTDNGVTWQKVFDGLYKRKTAN